MSAHKDFIPANEKYVANFADKGSIPLPPGKKLAIVTCQDARLDPAAHLGIKEGDAHVIRNAGGIAKDALRSLIISQQLLGTREIALFHHTDCGMLYFKNEDLRNSLKEKYPSATKEIEYMEFFAFSQVEESVKEDVEFLKQHPLILDETTITGWVYDVKTGKVIQMLHSTVMTKEQSEAPVIAVDLDDVLCQTNRAVADWHNSTYGTDMTIDDFHYYHYWKNPYWGSPTETHDKVKIYYATSIMSPKPVQGALEGVRALKQLGYKLVIITARHTEEQPLTQKWLDQYFPDIFDEVHCTGQFNKDEDGNQVHVKIGKVEVCHRVNAKLLIDDSAENALACARDATPSVPVLLFGDYSWNQRISKLEHPQDHLGYKERFEFEHGQEWWKKESVDKEFPENVKRVKNWEEVIAHVKSTSGLANRN